MAIENFKNWLKQTVQKPRHPSEPVFLKVLQQTEIFRTLSKQEIRFMIPYLYERTYDAGEPVFEEGNRGFGMYIILKGNIHIVSQDGSPPKILSKGELFGELSLLLPHSLRTSGAVAKEKSTVLTLFKADLLEAIERRPTTGNKILLQLSTTLGRRLVEANQIAHDLRLKLANPSEAKLVDSVAHET